MVTSEQELAAGKVREAVLNLNRALNDAGVAGVVIELKAVSLFNDVNYGYEIKSCKTASKLVGK